MLFVKRDSPSHGVSGGYCSHTCTAADQRHWALFLLVVVTDGLTSLWAVFSHKGISLPDKPCADMRNYLEGEDGEE